MAPLSLKALQHEFSQSLLYQDSNISQHIKHKAGFDAEQLLQIHRNNFIVSVTESLQCTYSNTLLLVGETFFNAVARQFILSQPPHINNICVYGTQFPSYLNNLEQLNSMPYVAEMARFECLFDKARNFPIYPHTFDVLKLQQIQESDFDKLMFSISGSCCIFSSDQDITCLNDMINNDKVEEVNLNKACYLLLNKQANFDVEIIPLTEQQWQLIQQLQQKHTLGELTPSHIQEGLSDLLTLNIISDFSIKQ